MRLDAPRHDGSPALPDRDFPITPSPAIGTVKSALSTILPGSGGLSLRLKGGRVTLVGERGIERWAVRLFGAPDHTVVPFGSCAHLRAERAAFTRGGHTSRTFHWFEWLDSSGKSIAVISQADRAPVTRRTPHAPIWFESVEFALSAERAWTAFRLPAARAALAQQGSLEFAADTWKVRIAPGFLEWGYPDRPMNRLERAKVGSLRVIDGFLNVDGPTSHPQVCGMSLEDYQLLLALLQELKYPLV